LVLTVDVLADLPVDLAWLLSVRIARAWRSLKISSSMAFSIWSFKGDPFIGAAQSDDAPWSENSSIGILVDVCAVPGVIRFEPLVVYGTISVTYQLVTDILVTLGRRGNDANVTPLVRPATRFVSWCFC
jgi:hypothetical protein